MPYRLEIALRPELFDAEGDGIRRKANHYFGIEIDRVRSIQVITIDANLSYEKPAQDHSNRHFYQSGCSILFF